MKLKTNDMVDFIKTKVQLLVRYWFWLYIDNAELTWREFWISRDWAKFVTFSKFAKNHRLYDVETDFKRQPRFVLIAALHDYLTDKHGYRGVIQTDDFNIKFLIWRYIL